MAARAAIEIGNLQDARTYLNEITEQYENSRAAEQALSLQGTLDVRG